MKKTTKMMSLLLAAIMLTCALSACDWGVHPVPEDNTSSSETFHPHKFGVADAAVKGVKIGMTQEQVKSILGEPDEEENVPDDNFIYGKYIDMTYGGLTLSFYDINEGDALTLGSFSTDSPEVIFAGGLHVGSTKDEVLATFTHDENAKALYFASMEESCGDYIYGDFNSDDFLINKPTGEIQYAYINRYGEDIDDSYMMEYYYYPPLVWNEDEDDYTGECYSMVFYMESGTDIVTDIRISFDLALH